MDERLVELRFDSPQQDRLDHFLVENLPEFSRSRLQGMIKNELVTVNGEIAKKTGLKLGQGAQISVRILQSQPTDLQPEAIPLDIIFENDDVIVINKSAGMVVHPSAGHDSGTLVHAALAHAPKMEGIGGEIRPGVVHRLDKDTSGILLVARTDHGYQTLSRLFKERKIKKNYLAIVHNTPKKKQGSIDFNIERNLIMPLAMVH